MNQNIDYSFVTDGGPIYHETLPGRFIVEPWNAFSSLIYLIPVLLLLLAVKRRYREHAFVVIFALPLLFTGGIGSTLYHAFRSERWLMFLDVFPMFVLSLGVAYYFMLRLLQNWYMPLLIIIASGFLRFYVFEQLPIQQAINMSYLIVGIVIFVPAILYARKTKWKHIGSLLLGAGLLLLSLFFRFYDDNPVQFMAPGVHWLWHVFSAAGGYFSGLYIIRTNHREPQKP